MIVVTRGYKQEHEKKPFDVLNKIEKAGHQASKGKLEFFMKQAKRLGHEMDENEKKPNKEKMEAIMKGNKIIPRCVTIFGKTSTGTFGKNKQTEKTFEKNYHGNWKMIKTRTSCN